MMDNNPLTKEHIEELNRLSQLPIEEQKVKVQEFLKTLTPEQLDFLKQHQGNGCVFCSIVEGKVSTKKIYEDDYLIGVLDIHPANKGHILLFPKVHYEILGLMEDVGHLFTIANLISKAVFDILKAEGTNILVSNGIVAGQHMPHVSVHIIPRFKNDKVTFTWEKVKVSDKEMDDIAAQLRNTLHRPQKNKIDDILSSYTFDNRRIP